MLPIFLRNYKRGLKEEDLFEPLTEHRSELLGNKLEILWKEENQKHRKAALHIALFRLFGLEFAIIGIIQLIHQIFLM